MRDSRMAIRYPNRFEVFRLEAQGEPPYIEPNAARQLYEAGKGLNVVPDGQPPAWFLHVSAKRYRFAVTYYTPSKTPLRAVTWEREDGELLCRRTVDLFYPDGDPRGRVRYQDLFSVTQDVSADGVLGVSLSSPLDDDRFQEVTGVTLDGFRLAMPAFGDWNQLIALGAPADVDRFGLEAIDAAVACADEFIAQGVADDRLPMAVPGVGWRIPAGSRDVLNAVDAALVGERKRADIPILERGSALVLPLAVQADPASSGREPREEDRRMRILADAIRDACEYREGKAIALDLDQRGTDRVAAYVSALRRAGATEAHYWAYGDRHGVVLVWTGDASNGTRTLALHIVPIGWVSDRRAKAAIDQIDVTWSSADVAAFAGADQSRVAGSLTQVNEEGQD